MIAITLTTDFGNEDPYVGIMKGVILNTYPYAKLIEITNNIRPQDISQASFVLEQSFKFFPKGTVHLCVVDPGVGSGRKPIILQTENYLFVGPDNGVFTSVLNQEEFIKAVKIENTDYMLKEISNTFHGRDIFAPAAAFLAKGVDINDFGSEIQKEELVLSTENEVIKKEKSRIGQVKYIDRFGNLITNICADDLPEKLKGKVKGKGFRDLHTSYTTGKANELLAIKGSSNTLELSVNSGNAQKITNASVGDKVEVKF